MAKVYFLRHQAGGVLHDFPFAAPPSDAQKAALTKLCFQRFGAEHPKVHVDAEGKEFKKPYWSFDDPRALVERDMLGASEVPEVPERSLSVANQAAVGQVTLSGTGAVTTKGE